jgi:two-component system LytT family response regulator
LSERRVPLSALVVDDEPLGRRGIVLRLARSPAVRVVGECGSSREAIAAIRRLKPDLLFLDVQMPGQDGFAVLEALSEEERPHVVFVTAHDQHAVRAFRVHALDYLLKPIDDERFEETLRRAIRQVERDQESDFGRRVAEAVAHMRGAAGPEAPRPAASAWPVRSRGKVTFVRLSDIDWVEAEGDYVRLHAAGRSHLVRETMAQAERRLPARRFVRIHRSTIVNTDRIAEVASLENGDWTVRLQSGDVLRLSRTRRDAIERLTRRG